MKRTVRVSLALFTFIPALLWFSACRTQSGQSLSPEASRQVALEGPFPALKSVRPELHLTFAGDIMAHNVNYNMVDYQRIYEDVKPMLLSDDLTFGNFEVPVADSLPLSTFPRFNVHYPYLKAAADGGFDVFSLANNHSNDQGVPGITGTISAFSNLISEYRAQGRMLRASGLRALTDEPLRAELIEINGWRILFLAVTELLNSHDASASQVYYIAPTASSRLRFAETVAALRKETPCDIFILSVHLNETEYVTTSNSNKIAWFSELAAAGVDIVWGHHPHVMQNWEHQTENLPAERLFMYSMGNFISGQRWNPKPDQPDDYREYTGDAVMLRVKCTDNTADSSIQYSVTPIPITNYRHSEHGMVVRYFDEAFISGLTDEWQKYYRFRYQALARFLPIHPIPLPRPDNNVIVVSE